MRGFLVLLGLSLTLGCGNGSSFSGSDEVGQLRQDSQQLVLPPRGVAQVALIAVDDDATIEGRAFRAAVAGDFRNHYDLSRVRATDSCEPPRDPAALQPVRRYAIVLAPSATGESGAHSFVEDPSLAWLADERLDDDAASWSDAVARAIEASETLAPDRYQPLAVLDHWLKLLAREASPADAREQAVVDALPERVDVETFLASTRDDDSPEPAADYRLEPAQLCAPGSICAREVRRFTPDPTGKCCDLSPARLPRLTEQAGHSLTPFKGCDELCEQTYFFDIGVITDCWPRCGDKPVQSESTGAVECRVLVATYHSDDCASTPGWTETSLSSDMLKTWRNGAAGYRICEIQQLQGDALDACVNDLDCKGCTPGFCATRVPELLADCGNRGLGASPWPYRFPQPPENGEEMMLDVQCDFER